MPNDSWKVDASPMAPSILSADALGSVERDEICFDRHRRFQREHELGDGRENRL
jgi:hypothetical protein